MESLLSFTISEKLGGTVSEAGLGPATELEVELSPRAEFHARTVSPLAHAKAGGRERTGHGCSFSNLSLPR